MGMNKLILRQIDSIIELQRVSYALLFHAHWNHRVAKISQHEIERNPIKSILYVGRFG